MESRGKEKKYAIILLEDLKESQLVGILLMTKWDQNLQVELTMGGLHSAFREKRLFYPFFKYILDHTCPKSNFVWTALEKKTCKNGLELTSPFEKGGSRGISKAH